MKKILLILIGLNSFIMATVTHSDSVANDSVSNLQWQDDDASISLTNDWQSAIDYCEALELNNKSDWRLANINELISIVDYAKSTNVFVGGFAKTINDIYWSSTTYVATTNDTWNVNFSNGDIIQAPKGDSHYVRCVRGGV